VRLGSLDVHEAVEAGLAAAVVSGIPSTVYAVATGGDPLEATSAAGSLLLPGEQRVVPLFLAAGAVHLTVSLGWALVLARVLPRRHTAAWGAAAGLGIAALDLGIVGRRLPRIRALPLGPQLVDHALYGAVVGAVLARRRG
jgi:hypothetical protein